MFTWICPVCGREVPPSYNECPDCAERAKTNAGSPPAPDIRQPVPAPAVPPPPVTAVPPPASAAVPTWLLTILFAFAFVGVGAAIYFAAHYFGGRTQASAAAPAATASAPAAAAAGKESPMQKYVEVSGIRFVETKKNQTEARFLVINHSGADISDLAGTVKVYGRAGKTEEPAGNFDFKVASLGPYESKEITAPLATKLKSYELPDWQFVSTDVKITSPE